MSIHASLVTRVVSMSVLAIVLLVAGAPHAEAGVNMTPTLQEGVTGANYSEMLNVSGISSKVSKLRITVSCTAGSVTVAAGDIASCNKSYVVDKRSFQNGTFSVRVELINISNKLQRTGVAVQALNASEVSLEKKSFLIEQLSFTPITVNKPIQGELLTDNIVIEWDKINGTLLDYYVVFVSQGEKVIYQSPKISKSILKAQYSITAQMLKDAGLMTSGTLDVTAIAIKESQGQRIYVGSGGRPVTYTPSWALPPSGNTAYPFTVFVEGPGSVSGTPQPYVKQGTVVTLVANPDPGQAFLGWSGSCTGTGACVVIVDGTESVLASFDTPSYQESQGLVVIEAESAGDFSGNEPEHYWEVRKAGDSNYFDGATGGAYLHFVSEDQASVPRAPITYKFKINESGEYHLYFRSHKNPLGTPDSGNDAYVRVFGEDGTEDANGYYFDAGSRTNFDADVASLHNPVKIASGSGSVWTWAEWVYPSGKKRVPIYRFDAGRTYTLEITGRSGGLDIDRIMFRNIDMLPGLMAKDYTHPVSSTVQPTNPNIPQISFGSTRVRTTERINVRQTPSLSGTLLVQTVFGETGTLVGGPQEANNFTWWQIRYDNGVTGWSGEDNLELVPSEEYSVSVPLSSLSVGNASYGAYSHIASIPNLSVGSTDPGVAAIQRYLNANGFPIGSAAGQPGSVGYESNTFGPATQAALARFQAARGISPANGAFGPQTRAAMTQ